MPIEWKLKEVLENCGLSVYALAERMGGAAGGASKRPGLYAITSSDPARRPSKVSFDLLSELLTSLSELTTTPQTIEDVLTFTPDRDWTQFDELSDRLLDVRADRRESALPRKRGRPPGSGRKK